MWDKILQYLSDNKDALGWLFGSGVVLAVLGGIYRFIIWLFKEYRLRKIRTNDNFPFKIISPNSNVAKEILGGSDDNPLADRNIPYQQRIQGRNTRRELEELIEDNRWILIVGRTGLGKTREAIQLAQSLNNEGWTILYLTREAWLDAPAKLPINVPERKVLFFLDDLNKKCYSSKAEVRPNASESLTFPIYEPFQTRLQRTLEAFDTFCGKSEIRVIATARNEKNSEFEEPSEWDKLGWTKYSNLWESLKLIDLPEPDNIAEQRLLAETAKKANVLIKSEELSTLARRNDGTFRNLVENLSSSQTEGFILSVENFRDTLKGTWEKRYQKAIQKYSEAKIIYDAIELVISINISLRPSYVRQVAVLLSPGDIVAKTKFKWRVFFVLKQLVKTENILYPRDGQIEAKNYRLEIEKYLPIVYKQIYYDWVRKQSGILMRALPSWDLLLIPESIFYPTKSISRIEKILCMVMLLEMNINDIALAYSESGFHFFAMHLNRRALELKNVNLFYKIFRSSTSITWNNLGINYYDLGQKEDAIQAYSKAIEFNSKYALPWNNLGRVYEDLGRYNEAIQAYQKAIELNPKEASPWNGLGNLYDDLKQYDDAIRAYQKAIELNPKEAYPWNGLGNLYDDLKQYGDAIRAYQKAIELNPKEASHWNNLGIIHYYLKQYDDAIQAYQKAIELKPKEASTWINLGIIYHYLKQYDDAIQAYQKAIELNPESASPWIRLGYVYDHLKQYDDAIRAYQKAIELNPKEASHWNGLGNIYRDLKQYDDAIQAYQKAIELDPKFASPWNSLGIIYYIAKDYEKSLPAYQKAVEISPDRGMYQASLVGSLRKLGKEIEAVEHEKIARSLIEKENEYNRACFESICGNTEEALSLLKIALGQKQINFEWVRQDPDFDLIRDDPRFKEMVEWEE